MRTLAAYVGALLIAVSLVGCKTDSIKTGIENQLKEFPESRVQDIYKSFCQELPDHCQGYI